MSKYYGDDEVESELEVGFMCLAVWVSTCQVCSLLPYFSTFSPKRSTASAWRKSQIGVSPVCDLSCLCARHNLRGVCGGVCTVC